MWFKKPFLFLLVLAGFSFNYSFAHNNNVIPTASMGVIDLRGQSFSEEIPLNGQWLFYWEQLIAPHEVGVKNGTPVNFPFKWTDKMNGGKEAAFGYATYKLKILLSKNTDPLCIAMPEVYCAYKLYINGKLEAFNGKVSTTEKDFIPYWKYNTVVLPQNTDTLVLLLQVANFAHSKGGIKKPLTIGKKSSLVLKRRQTEAIDLILTGCMFMGGLFFMGLYLMGNRDKAILLFSLYSIIYCYRVMGTDNYVLHTILPNLSWYVTIRLEYLSLFLSIGLFALYTRYLYPKDINKTIVRIICSLCFSFSIAVLCLAPVYFTLLVSPFLIVMVFCLVYVPYVYTKAYRRKRPGAIYTLMSAFALMPAFAITLLHYWTIIQPLHLTSFVCYITFFFLQSLILSHRVSFALKKARLEAEQGLVVKSEFLSTMSHEIRTPLNAVIGMSHLLLKNNPRSDQVEQLDVMLFSANNLLAIVNDILDYSKIEAGKISFEYIEMDIASIAAYIVKGLQSSAQDKGIELTLDIDKALEYKIKGDPTRTSQVITNLVHNAIKFTEKGFVQVSIEVTAQTETTATLNIQVKDTGIGISEEKQQLIFERFTQANSSTSRSFGGTGLGLSISKKLLELQNSSLELISEENKGSIFYFVQTFEKGIKKSELKHPARLPKEEDKPLTGIHILLVEDNAMNVLVAQRYLERWGATIDVALNGFQALHKFDVTRHKLILMDLHMPVLDGYEAARKLRKNGVIVPIVALTANLAGEIQEQIKQAGINDYVIKPFLPDELYRKVIHNIFPR